MATIGIEKTAPPIFSEVKSPLDISKLNVVGLENPETYDAYEKALKSTEDYAQALENRYAQPNWFKVAAGFAKPQLGGFLASLGSASEAMGENVEAQRAIAPSIARMRSEVAAQRVGMSQRMDQERLIQEYDKKGTPDINELRRIYSLAPDSPVGKSIEKRLEFETGRREEAKFGMGVQEALQKNPALIITDPVYKGVAIPEAKRNEYIATVNAGRPPGISPEIWNGMSFTERQDAIARAGREQIGLGLAEGQKSAVDAEQAHDVLDELTSLRKLAVDPSLKPVFSLFANGDLFSQLRAFLDKNPGNAQAAIEGLVNATMQKLGNVDEATRTKFDKLVKGIAEVDVRLRGTLNNPTDAASMLNTMRSPSLANSQAGFVGILDQLGLNSYRTIELNNLRRQKGLTKSDLLSTEDMRDFRNQTRELREKLASQSALDQSPSWFYPGKKAAAPAAPVVAPAAPGAPAAPSAAPRPAAGTPGNVTLSAIQQELARRQAAQGQQ